MTTSPDQRWTPSEDAIVLRHSPKVAERKLGGKRNRHAIRTRRHKLKHSLEWSKGLTAADWTPAEVAFLRSEWSAGTDYRKVAAKLSRFTILQIRNKASQLRLRRPFNGHAKIDGHKELVDQILLKFKGDGITIGKIDKLLGTGWYFKRNWSVSKNVNMHHVLKALDYYGAKLVIDWCER